MISFLCINKSCPSNLKFLHYLSLRDEVNLISIATHILLRQTSCGIGIWNYNYPAYKVQSEIQVIQGQLEFSCVILNKQCIVLHLCFFIYEFGG